MVRAMREQIRCAAARLLGKLDDNARSRPLYFGRAAPEHERESPFYTAELAADPEKTRPERKL